MVTVVAFSNGSACTMSMTCSAAVPSSSSDALPSRRVMSWAWLSSGKNGRSDLRISPWLSNSRNRIHSGLSNVRSPGTALMRSSVVIESSSRMAWDAGSGSRLAGAEQGQPGRALRSTSPGVGRVTMFCVNSRAVSGLMTVITPSVARASSSTWRMCSMLAGVNRSTTVCPSSIVNRLTIAWPPNRSW